MLNVEQLTKKLPDGRALLNGISFRVARGEFVGVLGASGAGKSLTLRCILGLTQADGGTATLQANDGQTFELTTCKGRCQREARRRMGVIFQGFNLVKRLRVIDNGLGFDPSADPPGRRGHFGCAGIRERGRKIGAEVVWHSALQRGTTVEVTLPLDPFSRTSAPSASSSC
mgnify:CR=1 FL=1